MYKALTCPTKTGKVFYVAPTAKQAKDVMWDMLHEVADGLIANSHINNQEITLVNGVTIALKGADRPETMRGVSLWFVVLDEYADMKPEVWETILRPALSDLKGEAIFIGTPMGRNHFYDLYSDAGTEKALNWAAFHFTSYDNPYLDKEEIEEAKREMSTHNFRQEYMASFESLGSQLFDESWVKFADESPRYGDVYIAIDPAGFTDFVSKKITKNTKI